MRSSVCTKSSSDGSRRRRCCHQLRQPRCCFGRCSLPARSTCERLTVGERLPKHPSVSQLTSRPDSVLSKCRRSRHPIPTQIATAPPALNLFPLHRGSMRASCRLDRADVRGGDGPAAAVNGRLYASHLLSGRPCPAGSGAISGTPCGLLKVMRDVETLCVMLKRYVKSFDESGVIEIVMVLCDRNRYGTLLVCLTKRSITLSIPNRH